MITLSVLQMLIGIVMIILQVQLNEKNFIVEVRWSKGWCNLAIESYAVIYSSIILAVWTFGICPWLDTLLDTSNHLLFNKLKLFVQESEDIRGWFISSYRQCSGCHKGCWLQSHRQEAGEPSCGKASPRYKGSRGCNVESIRISEIKSLHLVNCKSQILQQNLSCMFLRSIAGATIQATTEFMCLVLTLLKLEESHVTIIIPPWVIPMFFVVLTIFFGQEAS